MAVNPKIDVIFKEGVAGTTTSNINVDPAVVAIEEADGLLPNVKYLFFWYVSTGLDDNASNGAEVRIRTDEGSGVFNAAKSKARVFANNNADTFNVGPCQGFGVFTMKSSAPYFRMTIGRNPSAAGGTVQYSIPSLLAIPLDTLDEGTDYFFFEEATATLHTPKALNELFPSLINTTTFDLPDNGDYLCLFQICGHVLGNPGDLTSPEYYFLPAINAGWTTPDDDETPPVVNNVPQGTNNSSRDIATVGFHEELVGTGGFWAQNQLSKAWYSLETLNAGDNTFEIFTGGSGGSDPDAIFGRRIMVIRAASFPRGIVQSRQSASQSFTATAGDYEDSSLSLTIPATDGFHVVLAAAATSTPANPDETLETRIANETSGEFYSPEAGHSTTTTASHGLITHPLCSIGAADVSSEDGETVWTVQARRTGSTDEPRLSGGETGEDVDSNLIVWNLGVDPVPATIITTELAAQTSSLVHYLPSGRAWGAKNRQDSNLRSFFRGLAHELDRVTRDIRLFQDEILPDRTTLFLKEWEEAVAIPDNCFLGTGSADERRTDILTKLASVGVQTESDFIALASKFDLNITIGTGVEHGTLPLTLPFVLFATVTAPRFSIVVSYVVPDAVTFPYTFPIQFTTPALTILECLFNELKPANCQVVFVATPAP